MDAALAPAGSVVASAKLHVPEGDGAPPLRLQAARLALVAAPTAAVAAWAAAVARPVAWVALDPEDADPVRLWRCVIGALRVLAPGFGADAEAILAVGPAALDDAVVPLVAAEAAPWDEPPVLVLDRVQALGARSGAIVPSLARWLDRAPDGSSLVLAGDPAALADLGASLHAAAADPCVTPVTGTVPATEGLLRDSVTPVTGTVPATERLLRHTSRPVARTAGTPAQRIDAALAAGRDAEAAAVVAGAWEAALRRGEHATVLAWLAALPPAAAAADPGLWLVRVWAALQRGARPPADDGRAPALCSRGRLLHAADALRRADLDAAAAHLEAAGRHDAEDPFWHTVDALLRGQEAFWRGHPRVAHRHFSRAAGLAVLHGDRLALAGALGHLALLATEGGDDDTARRRLGRLEDLQDGDPAVAEHPVGAAGALAAGRMLELAGACESAVGPLQRALALAERGGGRLERAEPRLRLGAVHRACARPEVAEVLEAEAIRILAGCPERGRLAAPAAAVAHAAMAGPRDTLSPSERAVLRLLPSGLSQREIGATLFLSVNTVKTHCRNIYAKLHAGSRDEAVARAHDLGLL